jgi:peptide/nickel transport system permease protein
MRQETKRTLKRFFRNPSAIIGVSILVFFTIVAIAAPLIAPPRNPMDPSREISNPYIMPKITWSAEPIPPTSKSDALKEFISKGLERVFYKKSAEELAGVANLIIEKVSAENLCEGYSKSYTLKKEIKEKLLTMVNELKEKGGFSNPESLINSYMASDFVLVCQRAVEIDPGFSAFLKSFKTSDMKKGDLINIIKYGLKYLDLEDVIRVASAMFGVQGDVVKWMKENGYIKRDPIRTIDYHPFGLIDGRDIMYGVVWGTRTAFRIGIIVTFFGTIIGLFIGSIAGYYGGWIDEVLMRITDVFLSIPFLVAAIVLTTFLGTGLDKVMIAMIVFGWMGTARLIRGNILQVKEEQFILAAKALGVKDYLIIMRHVLPNTIFPVVIQASMRMGSLVITAAALSFLGLGAPTGYADWGSILNYSRDWILGAQGEAFKYWFALAYPGVAMVLFVLAWNLLGDALRDTFDPRLRV